MKAAKDVSRFLGMTERYQNIIAGYTDIADQLHQLKREKI